MLRRGRSRDSYCLTEVEELLLCTGICLSGSGGEASDKVARKACFQCGDVQLRPESNRSCDSGAGTLVACRVVTCGERDKNMSTLLRERASAPEFSTLGTCTTSCPKPKWASKKTSSGATGTTEGPWPTGETRCEPLPCYLT